MGAGAELEGAGESEDGAGAFAEDAGTKQDGAEPWEEFGLMAIWT